MGIRKPIGVRPTGRPKDGWFEEVREDLERLYVAEWEKNIMCRNTWSDVSKKAKTHTGL